MKAFPFLIFISLVLLSSKSSQKSQSFIPHFKSEYDATLKIDKNIINYINKQVAIDKPDEVIFFADSIIITEADTLFNVNVVFYANYFSIESNRGLTVISTELGYNGKDVSITALKIGKVKVSLPGVMGKRGTVGKPGKNGIRAELANENAVSNGTAGGIGGKGEKGGNGGNLFINTLNDTYSTSFSALKGKGGEGGTGGRGGITYFRSISKIINPGKPNQKIIYGAIGERQMPQGAQGPTGDPGIDGKSIKKVISNAIFEELATSSYVEHWKNIKTDTWRIIFRNKG